MQRTDPNRGGAPSEEPGFTLIELMMVVLIIGILIAVLIPVFIGASTRAKDRAMQANLRTALLTAKGIYTTKLDYTQATPAAMTAEQGGGALTFVPNGVAPNRQNTISVNAINAGYIILGGESKSGTCFYIADDQTTGTTLYTHLGGTGGCAATGAPLAGDPTWKPTW
jgi:type IV pilus assembly protein PilA